MYVVEVGLLWSAVGYEYTDVACSRLHVVIKWHIHDPFPPGNLWKHTTSLLHLYH